jgi:hypothetical protein
MRPQEVFDARDRGEEIEFRYRYGSNTWAKWNGKSWCEEVEFRIVKPEPKLVPHWPAVVQEETYKITDQLYPTVEAALKDWGRSGTTICLATEYPPLYLPEK